MTVSPSKSIGAGVQRELQITLTDQQAWSVVNERDRRFDGQFVYAVQSTGIYCRPSCPSRRPRREHVEFFASPEEAEDAGYRACRRCHPQDADGTFTEQAVEQARNYLEEHLDEQVTLVQLGEEVGMSPYHLQRMFKRFIGLSPKEYQDVRRLETFKEEAGNGHTVLEATYEVGFGSSRALYERSETGLGMTPGAYRRGGIGMEIRYAVVPTDFGPMLVAGTSQGVCAVSLGENADMLVAQLEEEFPKASAIVRDEDAVHAWAEPIIRYLEGVHAHPTVPLDVQGTDFQRRVWHALQQIPYGETRTYGEVAAMLGKPKAARAVASACASNNVALVVPCHRVVRSDRRRGGYRWGASLKEQLLRQEERLREAGKGTAEDDE